LLEPELLAVLLGLASALSWGAGDFSGGLATKRESVLSVTVVSQVVGISLLTALALLTGEARPSPEAMWWGAAAGVCGAVGIIALYQGLAVGRMGMVAPLSAIMTASIPVLVGILLEGLPSVPQVAGFAIALLAVWLISSNSAELQRLQKQELGLATAAGFGFAGFLLFINFASSGGFFWPLVAARASSISLLLLIAVVARRSLRPELRQLPLIFLTGILEVAGNAFYAAASQLGRLDIAAVLGSLYPASTVMLARLVLGERIHRRQWAGIFAALLAVVLIALG
jgi:drug/metabolite transporter (DMT)-like permease